jgi:ABC-type enterochelin transport system ATPase subunit
VLTSAELSALYQMPVQVVEVEGRRVVLWDVKVT